VSWDDFCGGGLTFADSALDSRRFGLRVARLTIGLDASPESVGDELVRVLRHSSADIVIARWPARLTVCAAIIGELAPGMVAADTLVYWDVPVDVLLAQTGTGDQLDSRVGDVSLLELESVFAESFRDYPSHYSANPAFAADKVLEGYLEWARRTAESRADDVVTLLRLGRPIGFATCMTGRNHEFLEILLAGLAATEQGSGYYATLLHGVGRLAQERGIPRVVISTQAGNVRVQRAWARAGFLPVAAFTTVHVLGDALLQ
jgi:hypothetical protein